MSNCGPGSVVGIATGYGLDGPGIESRPLLAVVNSILRRSGQYNPRRCRNRTGRYNAIRDDAHPVMRAVTGFPRSLRQSCTSIPIYHSQSLRPTGELCRSHKAYVPRCHLHIINQRTHRRHSPPSVFRQTRLSVEYGTLRLVHQPLTTLS